MRYLLAVAWTMLVMAASSESLSAQHTGSVLAMITTYIHLPLSPRGFEVLHILIRKAAHLTEYGILAFLWYRAVNAGAATWSWRSAAVAVAIAAVVATSDEIHQIFVPQRTPSPYDVLLDIAGATLAQLAIRMRS